MSWPFDLGQFLLRNQIVPLETGYGFVTGEGQNLREVIPGSAEVVQGTVAEIVEHEILDSGIFESNFSGPFEPIERFPIEKKDAILRFNSPKSNSNQVVTKGTEQ
jgi:hypothetical protein